MKRFVKMLFSRLVKNDIPIQGHSPTGILRSIFKEEKSALKCSIDISAVNGTNQMICKVALSTCTESQHMKYVDIITFEDVHVEPSIGLNLVHFH